MGFPLFLFLKAQSELTEERKCSKVGVGKDKDLSYQEMSFKVPFSLHAALDDPCL